MWKLFKVEVVKTHKSAFSRQIHEAVTMMREGGTILNSQEEYNRCLVPTLEVKGRIMETHREKQIREKEAREEREAGEEAATNLAETKHKGRGRSQKRLIHTII